MINTINWIKKISTLIFISFCFTSSYAQTKLAGKIYIAEVGETCKDGIGMIYTSRILKFDSNLVTSYYKVYASVSPELKEGYEHMYDHLIKTYKWEIRNDILVFENCKEFGILKIQKSKIIGLDNDWKMDIEFIELRQ
jgi:hypothetical protein